MPTLVQPEARRLIASQAEVRQAKDAVEQAEVASSECWVVWHADGSSTTLPRELTSMMTSIIETVARGGTVTVGGMPEDVTTTVAAQALGVSRPTLMRMVAAGELPAHKVGTHTRLKSVDVYAYRHAKLERQRAAIERLLDLEDEA